MKTKIIYISGSETATPADVRLAFDEVRNTLNLGADTVLFGVPLEENVEAHNLSAGALAKVDCAQPEPEPVAEVIEPEPIQKPKRTRKPKTAAVAENVGAHTLSAEALAKVDCAQSTTIAEPAHEKVIPILSVLTGGKSDKVNIEADVIPAQAGTPAETPKIQKERETIVKETVDNFLDEDLPASDDTPKTIEDIFKNLTPLPEEKIVEPRMDDESERSADYLEENETLAKLAAEFVDSQNLAVPPTPPARGGRMEKLKNILPFKKAKKDEPSMLGDLFGWAGIAANDEEIQVPGFFAARK